MAAKQIIINASISETRIALLEQDELINIHIERHSKQQIIGNVYLGKVIRVLPGMQSAFVDIGVGQAGFLYAKDVLSSDVVLDDEPRDESDEPYPANNQPIEKVIRDGQQIVVQVVKESYGSKGPRLTMGVAIPGRYLVLLPAATRIGISRKIENEAERKRLRELIGSIRNTNLGIIVRTAAEKIGREQLERDLRYLRELWEALHASKNSGKSPNLLHMDFSIVTRVARDLYTDEVQKIIVDDEGSYQELVAFFKKIDRSSLSKIELYRGGIPVFDIYGIERDIDLALQARVDLPSGGFVVVDETEALTTFDINTGKYTGRKNQSETILQTNLEAVKTVATQIRLRDIGGIIVIDFIDMNSKADREKVYKALLQQLKPDKARTSILKISDIGLVQMTRKRTRESLEKTLTTTCPTCGGSGHQKSNATIAYEIFRDVQRVHQRTKATRIEIRLREDIHRFIVSAEKHHLDHLQKKLHLHIKLQPTPWHDPAWEREPYQIVRI